MSIVLNMRPEVPPMSWKEFCQPKNIFGIALDGYVDGAPSFDKSGPWANFDHHKGVNRLSTRATCGQVFVAIKQGLFSCFRDIDGPRANVFANDCDEDVCLSWFLLSQKQFLNNANAALEQLVHIADLFDTTSGSYPFSLETFRKFAWVFDPYRRFRLSGQIDRKRSRDYLKIVDEVAYRILEYILGRGGSVKIDMRYERISGVFAAPHMLSWLMVKEIGAQARLGMATDGIRAYISVRERPDGKSWTYTVGRSSVFVPFNLADIFSELNKVEGCKEEFWGGGDKIGGSPRVNGSRLPPNDVAKIVQHVLETEIR